MSRSVARTVVAYAVTGALAAWLISFVAVVVWGARDKAQRADAIVVLGAAQYAGRPSPVLKARLDHALALWKRGIAARLVLTGGRGTGDTVSEAEVGRRYAMKAGVADSAILLEERRANDERFNRSGRKDHGRQTSRERGSGERSLPHATASDPDRSFRRCVRNLSDANEPDFSKPTRGACLHLE